MIFLLAFFVELLSFWLQPSDLSRFFGNVGYWMAVIGVIAAIRSESTKNTR
jgi:hypothetical protein